MMTPGKSNVETKGVQGGISRHYEFSKLTLSRKLAYIWLKYHGMPVISTKTSEVMFCVSRNLLVECLLVNGPVGRQGLPTFI